MSRFDHLLTVFLLFVLALVPAYAQEDSAPGLTLAHGGIVQSAAWNADETRIVTAGDDGFLRVWDAVDGALLLELQDEGALMGALWYGDKLLSWTNNGVVTLWDALTGDVVIRFEDSAGNMIRGAAIIDFEESDQSAIFAWSATGDLLRWDVATQAADMRLIHDQPIISVQFSADFTRMIVFQEAGQVVIRDVGTGEPEQSFRLGADDLGILWDAEREQLLSWGERGAAILWDIAGDDQTPVRLFNHSRTFVSGAAWYDDDALVLSWGADETVRLWDAANGDSLFIGTHRDWVEGAMLDSTLGRVLTWAFTDLTLWDVATGEPLLSVQADSLVSGAAFNADENAVLSWGWDGMARVWLIERE